MKALLPLNAKDRKVLVDPSTKVQMATLTKRARSKLATQTKAVADHTIEGRDLAQTTEDGLKIKVEGTSMTTEMPTQKHSHKYISLVSKERLVKMT